MLKIISDYDEFKRIIKPDSDFKNLVDIKTWFDGGGTIKINATTIDLERSTSRSSVYLIDGSVKFSKTQKGEYTAKISKCLTASITADPNIINTEVVDYSGDMNTSPQFIAQGHYSTESLCVKFDEFVAMYEAKKLLSKTNI